MIEAIRRTMDTDFADSQGPENLYVAAAYTGDAASAQEWKGELEEAFPGFDIYGPSFPQRGLPHRPGGKSGDSDQAAAYRGQAIRDKRTTQPGGRFF